MNTKKRNSAIFISLLAAALGIAMGLLGELMPDSFKNFVSSFVTESLGISYIVFWLGLVFLVVGLTLFVVWKGALSEESEEKSGGSKAKLRKVEGSNFSQFGDGHELDAKKVKDSTLVQDNRDSTTKSKKKSRTKKSK